MSDKGSQKILRGNLRLALVIAIEAEEEAEKGWAGSSAILEGWRDVLAALDDGRNIVVVD